MLRLLKQSINLIPVPCSAVRIETIGKAIDVGETLFKVCDGLRQHAALTIADPASDGLEFSGDPVSDMKPALVPETGLDAEGRS